MGVSGLWGSVKIAAEAAILERLAAEVFDEMYEAVSEGDNPELDRSQLVGLRVGIDASAWFFHSESSEGGANPELRTLFARCVRLAVAGCLPLFVFDGPHRPEVKRGKTIYRGSHTLQTSFIRIIKAFGFEWRVAPGEAEAELAFLNRKGVVELVITDDVDCLLFGATTVFKHALLRHATSNMTPEIYKRGRVEMETGLTVPGLILVALMSGGDYDEVGLKGVGPKIAVGLAKGGFGEDLAKAVKEYHLRDKLQQFLGSWRDEIRHELKTNERGLLERKASAVAKQIPDNWPDLATVSRYFTPRISELPAYKSFDKEHTWQKPIDLEELVSIMDDLFEYTHDTIIQKFRNQLWEAITVNHLVRSLHQPARVAIASSSSSSSSLTEQMAKTTLNSPKKTPSAHRAISHSYQLPADGELLLLNIEGRRNTNRMNAANIITDELRLVIDPSRFVDRVKKCLRHPDPNIGKLEARKLKDFEARQAQNPDVHISPIKSRPLKLDDPYQPQKLWLPESLLRLAVPSMVKNWEEAASRREAAKLQAAHKKKGVSKAVFKEKETQITLKGKAIKPSVDPASSDTEEDEDGFGTAVKVQASKPAGQTSEIHRKHHRRQSIIELLSDSEAAADSSIEIVTKTSIERSSPKKSPRRSRTLNTAKLSSRPIVPIALAQFNGPAQQTSSARASQAVYRYAEISDSDEDHLPLAHTKKSVPARSTSASSSSSTSHHIQSGVPSEINFAYRKPTKPPTRIAKPRTVAQEVVDLCSSD